MKKTAGTLILLLLLAGVFPARTDTRIQAVILDGNGFTAAEQSQWIEPGSDVSFRVQADSGKAVTAADYPGRYRIYRDRGDTVITLFRVLYPAHITLTVSGYAKSIRYEPNGGHGEAFETVYDLSSGRRPNTARGMDVFVHDGFTLTSWNTRPDGSGHRVGLGSRVSIPKESLTLFAQWAPWTEESRFSWTATENGAAITAYTGNDHSLVIPETLGGLPVTAILSGAFRGCEAEEVILPKTLLTVEENAFENARLARLTVFDNVEALPDAAFRGCDSFQTLYINAAEAPWGAHVYKESLYADKVDLLLSKEGQPRMVFYGGCSMWYNLDSTEARNRLGKEWAVVNMGLNGTVSSYVQLSVLCHYMTAGDVLFHTPEITSTRQMMTDLRMREGDEKLWSGLEFNYDLFSLADLRKLPGALDTWQTWRDQKEPGGSYADVYKDASGQVYLDESGGIPWIRTQGRSVLADEVRLQPERLVNGLPELKAIYERLAGKGIRIYTAAACINLDAVPEEEKTQLPAVDEALRAVLQGMPTVPISRLDDYVFRRQDFYDTNYHLLSQSAYKNTLRWLADLEAQMRREKD